MDQEQKGADHGRQGAETGEFAARPPGHPRVVAVYQEPEPAASTFGQTGFEPVVPMTRPPEPPAQTSTPGTPAPPTPPPPSTGSTPPTLPPPPQSVLPTQAAWQGSPPQAGSVQVGAIPPPPVVQPVPDPSLAEGGAPAGIPVRSVDDGGYLVASEDHSSGAGEVGEDGEAESPPLFPTYDRPYQPKPSGLKETFAAMPYWMWLAVVVAMVTGIVLVLIFGPSSTPKPDLSDLVTPLPSQSAPLNQAGQGREAGQVLLPLATPAPPGRFHVDGFNIYSGPNDEQLNPGSVITPDTRVTFKLHYAGAQYEDAVQVKWEIDGRDWGTEEVHLNPWTTSQWFVRDRPEDGWPEGRYRLTVYHDDKEVSSIFFEVSATGESRQSDFITIPNAEGESPWGDTSADDPVWATPSPSQP